MSLWLPSKSPIARAARGWSGPGVKPTERVSPRASVLGNLKPVALYCPFSESGFVTGNDPYPFHNLINGYRGNVSSNGSNFRGRFFDAYGNIVKSNYTLGADAIRLVVDGDSVLNEKSIPVWDSYTFAFLFSHEEANSIAKLHHEQSRFCQWEITNISDTNVSGRAINNTNWTAGADFNFSCSLPYGKPNLLAMVWDGSKGTRRIYANDDYQEHTGFSGTLSSSSTVSSSIVTLTHSKNAGYYYFAIFHGAATPEQLQELHRNPYPALFEPANQSPYFISVPSAGGGAGDITADFLNSSATIYQPTLQAGAADLAVDFLDSTASVYQPTLGAGASGLVADFVDSTASIYSATLAAGAAGITAGFLDTTAAIYQPTLEAGAADLVADFLDSTATIYDQTLAAAGATISADFLDSTASIFQPTLGAGAADLAADFLNTTASIYQPVLGGVATLTADFLDSTAAIPQPTLTGAGTVVADFINSTATIYIPTLGAGAAPIAVDFLNSTAAIYSPTLSGPQNLELGFLDTTAAIYQPSLIDPALLWTPISATSTSWTEIPDDSTTWTEI